MACHGRQWQIRRHILSTCLCLHLLMYLQTAPCIHLGSITDKQSSIADTLHCHFAPMPRLFNGWEEPGEEGEEFCSSEEWLEFQDQDVGGMTRMERTLRRLHPDLFSVAGFAMSPSSPLSVKSESSSTMTPRGAGSLTPLLPVSLDTQMTPDDSHSMLPMTPTPLMIMDAPPLPMVLDAPQSPGLQVTGTDIAEDWYRHTADAPPSPPVFVADLGLPGWEPMDWYRHTADAPPSPPIFVANLGLPGWEPMATMAAAAAPMATASAPPSTTMAMAFVIPTCKAPAPAPARPKQPSYPPPLSLLHARSKSMLRSKASSCGHDMVSWS